MKRRKTPESLTGIETSLASPMGQSTPIGVAKPPNPSQGLKLFNKIIQVGIGHPRRKTPESLTGIETPRANISIWANAGRKTPESLTGIETSWLPHP